MTPRELLAPPVSPTTAPPADRTEATARLESAGRVAAARIVIATDGSHAADAALWFGNALAQRDGADALIVTVYEPLPTYDPAAAVTTGHAELEHVLAQDGSRPARPPRRSAAPRRSRAPGSSCSASAVTARWSARSGGRWGSR
jgi:hypothetical protein